MYSIVWPNVREQATRILKKCAEEGPPKAGDGVPEITLTGSWLDDAWFPYMIQIRSTYMKIFLDDGWKMAMPEDDLDVREMYYNVYEPGGTSSGVARKGVGRPFGWGIPSVTEQVSPGQGA